MKALVSIILIFVSMMSCQTIQNTDTSKATERDYIPGVQEIRKNPDQSLTLLVDRGAAGVSERRLTLGEAYYPNFREGTAKYKYIGSKDGYLLFRYTSRFKHHGTGLPGWHSDLFKVLEYAGHGIGS